jgi:hypothetical protein
MSSPSGGRASGAKPGASRLADSLALAASPVFAVLALATALGGPRAPLCAMAPGGPWNAMATMYLLMAGAHLPPWLKLMSRRGGDTDNPPATAQRDPHDERDSQAV